MNMLSRLSIALPIGFMVGLLVATYVPQATAGTTSQQPAWAVSDIAATASVPAGWEPFATSMHTQSKDGIRVSKAWSTLLIRKHSNQ